ncbi:MAG: hypothetical protein K940chlam8_00611 [Chlamydiae bacterium]|nr:hypothetical protein [Chlamydiota bacterium]
METQREHWTSSFGFIMAAAGSAIGLGTLWQFPYMVASNGGSTFVIAYLICIFFLGIPVFIAELILGRASQRGAVGTFHTLSPEKPFWNMTGWLGIFASLIVLSYYCIVSGWGLNYFLMSINQYFLSLPDAQIAPLFDVLYKSGSMNLFWQFIFMLITVLVVFQGVRKGIEHWAKILTTLLLILLLFLLVFSLFQGGTLKALRFLFVPDWSLLKPATILSALGLSFFTLSLGEGIMITYGSYMKKSSDVPKTAIIVSLGTVLVSLFSVMMVFSIVFAFDLQVEQGIGLIFKTLPVLFTKLPAKFLISSIFFLLLVFTALTSSVGLLETLVANWMDLSNWSRKKAVIVFAILAYVVGIPSALSGTEGLFKNWSILYGKTFFETMVDMISTWIIPIAGLLVVLFTGWKLEKTNAKKQFELGSKLNLFSIWYFFIKWVAPVAIVLVILQSTGMLGE